MGGCALNAIPGGLHCGCRGTAPAPRQHGAGEGGCRRPRVTEGRWTVGRLGDVDAALNNWTGVGTSRGRGWGIEIHKHALTHTSELAQEVRQDASTLRHMRQWAHAASCSTLTDHKGGSPVLGTVQHHVPTHVLLALQA